MAALLRGARVDRWRRVALASVKQSRRAVLPDIRVPLTFETLLDEPPPRCALMLVEPAAAVDVEPMSALQQQPPPVGRAAARSAPKAAGPPKSARPRRARGVRLVTLGHRTLRADAVAVAAISVLQFLWGDL